MLMKVRTGRKYRCVVAAAATFVLAVLSVTSYLEQRIGTDATGQGGNPEPRPIDHPPCLPKQCDDCGKQVEVCGDKVHGEISKAIKLRPRCSTDQMVEGCESCIPKFIMVTCASILERNISRFPCENDLLVPEFDYHSQQNCLEEIALNAANQDSTAIPRIGHTVFFDGEDSEMQLSQHLSVVSLVRHLKARVFFLWNDGLPKGRWWIELLLRLQSPQYMGMKEDYEIKFYSVFRSRPSTIYGKAVRSVQTMSDIVRLEALIQFGGGYLDLDTYAVKDLSPLLSSHWVMGYDHWDLPSEMLRLHNGVMLGRRNANFAIIWHCEYFANYDPSVNNALTTHGMRKPHILAEMCPHFIRREPKSLQFPDSSNLRLLYGENERYDLSKNFVVNGWHRESHPLVVKWRLNYKNDASAYVLNPRIAIGRVWRSLYLNEPL